MSEALEVSRLGGMLDEIQKSTSVDELVQIIKRLDAIKTALEAEQMFEKQAIKFAILQYETILRIIDLGGAKKLTGNSDKRRAADWLSTLSQKEKDAVRKRVESGELIIHIYRDERTKEKERTREKRATETAKDYTEWLIDTLGTKGIVDTTRAREEISEVAEDEFLANSLIERMRDDLLKAGAVGVGNGTRIYVDPESNHKDEIEQAILTRVRSIIADYNKLLNIAKVSNTKISEKVLYKIFQTENGRANFLLPEKEEYKPKGLDDCGGWSDEESCFQFYLAMALADEGMLELKDGDYFWEDYIELKYPKYKSHWGKTAWEEKMIYEAALIIDKRQGKESYKQSNMISAYKNLKWIVDNNMRALSENEQSMFDILTKYFESIGGITNE